jgi:hypothetical protein
MTDIWMDPTPEQSRQAERVTKAICHEINLLAIEGIDPRVIIAGLGAATADTLTCVFGETAVVPWFEKQADMVRGLHRKH